VPRTVNLNLSSRLGRKDGCLDVRMRPLAVRYDAEVLDLRPYRQRRERSREVLPILLTVILQSLKPRCWRRGLRSKTNNSDARRVIRRDGMYVVGAERRCEAILEHSDFRSSSFAPLAERCQHIGWRWGA